jgi:4a-hydroxytetrahydrobiopterin dehydratase
MLPYVNFNQDFYMKLSEKACVPCHKGAIRLRNEEIAERIKEIQGWTVVENKAIRREYKFKNFRAALEFVNKVGNIAEENNHHPDIEFGWGYCNITLQTHSIGGLHENDFIVAAKINTLGE